MAKHSTYSFTDINATISCPGYGSFSIQGEGVGNMDVSKMTDRTVHDVAADGSIMASKIAGNNGTITVNAQQTSSLHKFMQGMFNYCWQADTSAWTTISLTIEAPKMGKTFYGTGGSFVKEPNESLQSQGQLVAWPILFKDIQRIQM